MRFKTSDKKLLLLLVLLVFVVKSLIVLFAVHHVRLWEVNAIALNMLHSGEMKYFHDGVFNYNFQFPEYPFLVFLIYKIFGVHYKLVLLFNVAISSVTAWMLYHVFEDFTEHFNLPWQLHQHKRLIVFLAVVAFLVHPLISYYAMVDIHPFTFDLFMATARLYFMFNYFHQRTKTDLLLYALVLGAAVLDRTTLIATIAPFIVITFRHEAKLKALGKILAVCLVGSLFSFVWMCRNYRKMDAFSLNSSLGQNLWIGTLPQTQGTANFENGKSYYAALSKDELAKIPRLSAVQQNRFYLHKYWSVLKNNPGRVVQLFFVKWKNFWWFRKNIGVGYNASVQRWVPVYEVAYVLCLLLALLAIVPIKRRFLTYIIFPIALSVMQALVYVETRHRILIEPFILLLSVIGAIAVVKYLAERIKSGSGQRQ